MVLPAIVVISCKFCHQIIRAGCIALLQSGLASESAFIIVVAKRQICVSSLARKRTLDGCAGEPEQHDGNLSCSVGSRPQVEWWAGASDPGMWSTGNGASSARVGLQGNHLLSPEAATPAGTSADLEERER